MPNSIRPQWRSKWRTALICTLFIGGCATTPPPEEICSAGWIKPRTDAALAEFKEATDGSWRVLKRSGEAATKNGTLGVVDRVNAILSLTRLVGAFQNSDALADLRTLGATCDDPDLAGNALRGVLQEYGVPQPYIELLNELEAFVDLMSAQTST